MHEFHPVANNVCFGNRKIFSLYSCMRLDVSSKYKKKCCETTTISLLKTETYWAIGSFRIVFYCPPTKQKKTTHTLQIHYSTLFASDAYSYSTVTYYMVILNLYDDNLSKKKHNITRHSANNANVQIILVHIFTVCYTKLHYTY